MFTVGDGTQYGAWPLPAEAELLPDGHPDGNCKLSTSHSARTTRDRESRPIYVNFTGAFYDYDEKFTPYNPSSTGKELTEADGDFEKSAWIFLFQARMLSLAQLDIQSSEPGRRPWSNTHDGGDNTQSFNPEANLQECDNLDRMMYLATGKKTTQKPVESCNDKTLDTVLKSMSKSPVLVIPKAATQSQLVKDGLSPEHIWIGKSQDSTEKTKWVFWDPVDNKEKPMGKSQLRDLVKDIVYFDDHSSL